MGKRPIRLLHCLAAVDSGGVEMRRIQIVRAMGRPDFEHMVLCTHADGPARDQLVAAGAEIVELGVPSSVLSPKRYIRAAKLAREWRPNLVHGAVMEGVVLAAVTGRLLRVPTIIEETSEPSDRRLGGHLLVRAAALTADSCVAVSPTVAAYLSGKLRIPVDKVRIITNGVPQPQALTAEGRARLRESLDIPATAVVVGTVSRLYDDHKRTSDIIRAFFQLDELEGVHLLIVGDGQDRLALETLAWNHDSAERIHFVGRQVPADPYLAAMDIFAIASAREAFGLVAAEAMHAGLPVVATRVGGLAEIVRHESTGLLVDVGRPDQLASAFRRLIRSASVRAGMGSAGKERARAMYSSERYVEEVRSLYRDTLAT